MAKENPEWVDPWEANPYHTGSFTGRKGNKGKAVWNPYTQKIEKYTQEEYNKITSAYRKENGERMFIPYENVFGEMVFGHRPEETHMGMTPGGESIIISGPDPFAGNRPTRPETGNNTPVPWWEENPNFDPDKVPEAPPPQEGGPGFTYPSDGNNPPTGNPPTGNPPTGNPPTGNPPTGTPPTGTPPTGDPWTPPTGGVEDSVFDNTFNWNSGEEPPGFKTEYWLGEDAPWGNAGVPGDNASFYKQQLNNLRGQEQHFQESAIGAAIRRKAAADAPAQAPSDPWGWAYGGKGLPEVKVAGGTIDNPTTFGLRSDIIPGETSNADLIRRYGTSDPSKVASWTEDGKLDNDYSWSQGANPQELINYLGGYGGGLADSNVDWLSEIYRNMFVEQGLETPEGGGPVAAPGYAI